MTRITSHITIIAYSFYSFVAMASFPAICLGMSFVGVCEMVCDQKTACDSEADCCAGCEDEFCCPINVASGSIWTGDCECPSPDSNPALTEHIRRLDVTFPAALTNGQTSTQREWSEISIQTIQLEETQTIAILASAVLRI